MSYRPLVTTLTRVGSYRVPKHSRLAAPFISKTSVEQFENAAKTFASDHADIGWHDQMVDYFVSMTSFLATRIVAVCIESRVVE